MDFFTKGDFNMAKYLKELYGSVENLITQAKKGNVSAQIDLGIAYCEGLEDFVEQDSEKAIGWLNTAVENGCVFPSVLQKLGQLLDLKGEPHNQRKAYEMYHRAARLGSTSAQLNLAEMYRCGVEGVVNEDIKEAFEWYKKAAGESTSVSQLYVGTMTKIENAAVGTRQKALTCLYKYYLEGDCPEGRPQRTKAVYYLTRAAELGDTGAQRELGQIYLTGSCDQIKDLKKAKRWLEKASANGDVMAKQLLQQCKLSGDTQHDASEIREDAMIQSFSIMEEKLEQRAESNKHPFTISQPFAFSEEILQQYDWSPTARIYLQAYKLVKEGLEILHKSNFTDGRGITLIAHGYLTENSILQAFPQLKSWSSNIFQLCDENLRKNPCFFEGLLFSFILCEKSKKGSLKGHVTIKNLIYYIQKAEPNSSPCKEPFEFDKNYTSWLHVLYYHLAAFYTISQSTEKAAEAFENSLKCCPSYYDAKRGLGFSLIELCTIKETSDTEGPSQDGLKDGKEAFNTNNRTERDREISKYASWTAENLRDTAVKILKEFLEDAPTCFKYYPSACYYLANLADNMVEFKKYYELGQDAEEKRLPFFDPVDLPLKDLMAPDYQLLANVRQPVRCGNKACIGEVKENDLKSCGRCGKQKYCSKDCQKAD